MPILFIPVQTPRNHHFPTIFPLKSKDLLEYLCGEFISNYIPWGNPTIFPYPSISPLSNVRFPMISPWFPQNPLKSHRVPMENGPPPCARPRSGAPARGGAAPSGANDLWPGPLGETGGFPWGNSCQWPFQDPKLEVPTIYKAYIREYPHKIWPYTVQYLHFRILEFPLILGFRGFDTAWSILLAVQPEKKNRKKKGHLLLVVLVMFHFFLKKNKGWNYVSKVGDDGHGF